MFWWFLFLSRSRVRLQRRQAAAIPVGMVHRPVRVGCLQGLLLACKARYPQRTPRAWEIHECSVDTSNDFPDY